MKEGAVLVKPTTYSPNVLVAIKRTFGLNTGDLADIFHVNWEEMRQWEQAVDSDLAQMPKSSTKLIGGITGGLLVYVHEMLLSEDLGDWIWMPIPSLAGRSPYELLLSGEIGALNCYLDNLLVDEGWDE